MNEVTIALILTIGLHKLLQFCVSEVDDVAFDQQGVSEKVEVVIEGSLEYYHIASVHIPKTCDEGNFQLLVCFVGASRG